MSLHGTMVRHHTATHTATHTAAHMALDALLKDVAAWQPGATYTAAH